MCYIIKALKDKVSPHILRNVYFTKFQPQISYGLIFWGGESESNRILMLQKRVLCIMKGVTKRTSYRDILRELQMLKVTSLYILEVLSYSKKHNIYIMKNSDLYEYDTRRKENLHV
jgi:hypothetical protein